MSKDRTIESNMDSVIRGMGERAEGLRSYTVSMVTTSTGGRSAKRNAQILWIHWHGGRNKDKRRRPWFTSAAEWRKIQANFQEVLMSGRGSLRRAADAVGKETRDAYAKHVRTGKNARGTMAPLSKGYKEWKDKVFPGRPILVRTGQLWKSVKPKVQRL